MHRTDRLRRASAVFAFASLLGAAALAVGLPKVRAAEPRTAPAAGKSPAAETTPASEQAPGGERTPGGERAAPLPWIRPSADGSHFVTDPGGERFVVWGVNYDHDHAGRLLEDYWHAEWPTVEADFREIRDLGANVVRVHLQLGRFMRGPEEPDAENLARLGKLIALAEELGLYLDLTGLGCYHKQDVPAWYDALDEAGRWAVQARFWQAVAEVGRESPAVFCYDLMNEPILPGAGKPEIEWLAGELGGKHFVQRITLDLKGRSREEVARLWVARLAAAIRQVDPRHMLAVGEIPWAQVFPGAKPLFCAPEIGAPLDLAAMHFYPKAGEVDAALTALKVYEVGKPLVVEEMFPLACSIEELDQFIEGSRPFCDGWISFYWGRTIEEYEQDGDLKGAILAAWLKYFRDHAPGADTGSKE